VRYGNSLACKTFPFELTTMSRTPARITQADVARAIRAAQQCGAGSVRIMPDGTILIDPQRQKQTTKEEKAVEPEREIVL